MSQIVVSAELAEQLCVAPPGVELRTPEGKVLGHFVPHRVEDYDPAKHPPIDIVELNRRCAEEKGRSLKEIWADLRKREAAGE